MRVLLGPILLLTLGALAPHASSQQGVKILSGDPDARDEFGISASAHGAYLVIGAFGDDNPENEAGAAYVFHEENGVWSPQLKLMATDADFGDRFGAAVCMQGDRIVIGAAEDSEGTSRAGAAYIFERDGVDWVQVAKLIASDPNVGAEFGLSVSLSGDRAIVGAPRSDVNGIGQDVGAAYIFERNGGAWTETKRLACAVPAAYDRFGRSVAIDGDTVVVGAFGDDDNGSSAGTGYPYRYDGMDWVSEGQLLASDPGTSDQLGIACALSGDVIVMGAWADDDDGDNSGSAYVFTRDGSTWTESDKLIASDASTGDLFGISVAIDGDTIVVGAVGNAGAASATGAAYRFISSDMIDWVEQERLVPFDGTDGDAFGVVAIRGHTIVVGSHSDSDADAEAGSAYIFERPRNVGQVYCMSNPNSTGNVAMLSLEGSGIVGDADLLLRTVNMPGGASGLYFFGPNQIQLPFGEGIRCVGGIFRRMNPPVHANGSGVATRNFNWTAPYATSITVGATQNFQLWYRNAAGGPNGFNMSTAVEVIWR
ncbi:MAG: hypothetical protein ACI8QZ_003394 [Chlamydiales bacterium]|jgi:hypothetical protein